MKRICLISLVVLLAAFLLPVLTGFDRLGSGVSPVDLTPAPSAAPSGSGISAPSQSPDDATTVKVLDGDQVLNLTMDEYLKGVVAAEMPASFDPEALKAQAVAARTFTLYRMNGTPMEEHKGADVCTDYAHCKAYLSPDREQEVWGENASAYAEKIAQAVEGTDGTVVLYEEQPILSVFHSTSSGRTENSGDVWSSDLPYLQSVESMGEESSPRYYGRVEMDPQEFQTAFLAEHKDADLSGEPGTWISDLTRSQAGGVLTAKVGGITVKGTQLRTLLGLQSTNFTVSYEDGKLVFQTVGYGHGVGMSQYGAQAMALSGSTYEEILEHYYTGVAVKKLNTYEAFASGG